MAEEYPDFFPQQFSPITNVPPKTPVKDLSFSSQFVESETSLVQTDQLAFPGDPAGNDDLLYSSSQLWSDPTDTLKRFRQRDSDQIGISTGTLVSSRIERRTELLTPPTGALNVPATQSLVAALQSTMKAKQAVRQPVVIPGNKRRRREVGRAKAPIRRRSSRLRLFVTLGALVSVLLISLFALSPLSDSNIPLAKSLAGWTQTQQITWNSFIAHITGTNPPPAVTTPNQPAVPPVQVLSTSQYVAIAQQDAVAAGISPTYFTRQIMLESGFNPNAISPSGAVGIAQFEPSTAAGLGFNPYDPVAALKGAANYMARLSSEYGGDYTKALAAYNAGSGTVNSAIQRGGANWLSLMPAETQNYVARITGA
jgi:soluble lytic murein transglycosylase-like protein